VGLGAPLGTRAPVAISAAEPRETEETDTEASTDAAASSLDGPDYESEDEAGGDADDEAEDDVEQDD
jgi:hypothetical protein